MKYPARVHTQGETIKFLRRKPSGTGRASWHSKEREVHCSSAECPNGELAVKVYWSMILEAGVDIAGIDLKDSDIRTLAAIVTDGFLALMRVQE
jgi:hypothetical protein